MRWHLFWAGLLSIASSACQFMGGAVPPEGAVTLLDFSGSAFPFDNPVQGELPGFAAGKWLIQGGALDQVEGRQDNLASHLRYRGKAFGTDDGRAGRQYGLDVTCRATREVESAAVHGFPTGILACMPYYRDPTHYLMLVAARQELACWWVDGLSPAGAAWPETGKLWSRWLDSPLDATASIRWGADVDLDGRRVSLRLDGRAVGAVDVPALDDRPHWVALASNGNFVRFDDLRLVHRR